jgi:hypothetical protein
MSAYTDKEKVEAFLNRELSENEETLLDSVISYISIYINNYTGRVWNDIDGEFPDASSKLYDGNGKKEIFVDDFASISSIELLDSQGDTYVTLTDETEFLTYPMNDAIANSIYLRNYRVGTGAGRIKITGVWTSGDVPDDVIMVATALVGRFLNRRDVNSASFKKESIEGYSYEILTGKESDEEVKTLLLTLDSRRKISL